MNKSSSLLLHLHLHLFHFLIINKSSYFQKKKNSKRALGLGALGSYFLGCFKKKSPIKIFNSFKKIQDFQIFFKKKKSKIFNSFEKFKFSKFKKKKKIFIKFFYRNRKLWSSSTFSSDATSSQLSTLSIHRSMEYVPN